MILAPAMVPAQRDAWLALLEITERLPHGWCLIGGQLVHLYCWERGLAPTRATTDGDAALDVRGRPDILRQFTGALAALGFTSAGQNMSGHEHRWIRGEASIDVLIPSDLGQAATRRTGVTGSTTVVAPGTQQAIERTELIDIDIDGRRGRIPRPNLLGALVVKAAAHGLTTDSFRDRHLTDLAALAAMIRRSDNIATQLTKRDRQHLTPALAALATKREVWIGINGAERGIDLLTNIIARP